MTLSGDERRQAMLELLRETDEPISGSRLAERFGVSRQVIVQDMALLRARERNILSTFRGYRLESAQGVIGVFPVWHENEAIRDELYAIVDAGGRALDVFIEHATYGILRAELNIGSRREADLFLGCLKERRAVPLTNLTQGYHFHTVSADSTAVLGAIAKSLKQLDILKGDWQEI